MILKNLFPIAEVRSQEPLETQALLSASMRSYSPRSAGIMPDDSRMLVLGLKEIPEFIKGLSRDVTISDGYRRVITAALSDFLAGKRGGEYVC